MGEQFNFNSVLIIVLGFLATYFIADVKEAIKMGREALNKLSLVIQRQDNDKTSTDTQIQHLKENLKSIREEADELCARVEQLERQQRYERTS